MSVVDQLVTAKFVLDSSGFNNSIKGINAELRNAQSEFKNASTELGVFGKDSEKLKSVQEALAKQVELHAKKVDTYKQSMEQTSTKMNENISIRDKLKSSLDNANKAYDEAVKLYGKESDQAKNAKSEVEKLTAEYSKKEKAIETNAKQIQNYETNMNKANAQMTIAQGELNKINAELDKSNNKWLQASEVLKEHGDRLQNIGKGMEKAGEGILKATAPLVAVGAASLKAGIDFESAFAGVKKTVDATDEEFKRLEAGIRGMTKDIPASATAIAGVAEAAGQLGIQTENILEFSRVMIDLGEATNLSANDAATALAQFANITQMSQEDFDKLGSTIVDLGNNLATTEADIVNMGKRLAGAGSQIGLTEAEIMSFAGALSSVGIEAEAGGSAFSKTMIEMQLAVETNSEKLVDFASVAGMTGEEFSRAFKDDAAGAITEFIKGLSNAEEQGASAIKVLDDMGITEIRMRDALLRASGASDVFTSSLEIGTKAWEENTALSNEAAQRYETTASELSMLKNQFVEAGLKLSEVLIPYMEKGIDKVGEFADWLGNLDKETLENTAKMVGFAAAIGGILKVGGGAISTIGGITKGVGTLAGLLGTATTATAGIGTAAATAGGIGGMGALTAGLGTAAAAVAPFALAAAGVVAAGVGIKKALDTEVIPEVDLFADKIEYAAISTEENYGRINTAVETTTTKISESTKEAVGSYLELDEGVKSHLDSIYINSTTITEDMKNELVAKYDEMATQINVGTEQKRAENIASLENFFKNSKDITELEQADLIFKTNEYYNKLNSDTQIYQDGINEMIDRASRERRELQIDEVNEINRLQELMKTQAIKTLSDNEIEAKIILERMKEYDGRITAEQASAHITELIRQKDGAVTAANEEYEERLATIIKMRDEAKVISAEQADDLIKEAQRQRDGIIKEAENTHTEALNRIKEMHSDLENEVDISTGNILTWWDKLKSWWSSWTPEKKTFETSYSGSGGNAGIGSSSGSSSASQKYDFYSMNKSEIDAISRRENVDVGIAQEIYRKELETDTRTNNMKTTNNDSQKSNDVNIVQNIYVPVSSPSEVARQAKKAQQELALGF
ncbi:phage tail tape measure protein [Sedimentibacter hydroxybenzoicus DSM 7310]|uniref:Phage tail tape measure protein n=1 Tax=Sedimentibacter hydroxybenzoicus DSM 7310 TaxID=1123245 RepID=A0A974GVW8_SEDHY|nr:phage tail tape measure protein [Sedimentibacter hydroxybenzoicus]NYB73852.1 phage tail tape measure protein [Sedimentibacter hydroxybenzoicus DSM 7310]